MRKSTLKFLEKPMEKTLKKPTKVKKQAIESIDDELDLLQRDYDKASPKKRRLMDTKIAMIVRHMSRRSDKLSDEQREFCIEQGVEPIDAHSFFDASKKRYANASAPEAAIIDKEMDVFMEYYRSEAGKAECAESIKTRMAELSAEEGKARERLLSKGNRQSTKKKIKDVSWKELVKVEAKVAFKNIVHVLNRYYDRNPSGTPSDAVLFRKAIVATPEESFRVFLKKFGTYEFLLVVELTIEGEKKMDSWIHIDGIAQERIILKEKGIENHPVFNITSICDIYESFGESVGKEISHENFSRKL